MKILPHARQNLRIRDSCGIKHFREDIYWKQRLRILRKCENYFVSTSAPCLPSQKVFLGFNCRGTLLLQKN
jgi:hypothetical protein